MALRWGIGGAHAKWSVCQVCSNMSHAPPRDWSFHMWDLPGWSDNERRETKRSDGEVKSPLAKTDRRRDQGCASSNIFFIHPSFHSFSGAYCSPPQHSLYRKLSSIWATTNPCMTSVPLEQMWGFRVDILPQKLITDWPLFVLNMRLGENIYLFLHKLIINQLCSKKNLWYYPGSEYWYFQLMFCFAVFRGCTKCDTLKGSKVIEFFSLPPGTSCSYLTVWWPCELARPTSMTIWQSF